MKAKLEELKQLMGYFELVSVTFDDSKWILRNITDEGLGSGTNRVMFQDSDLEVLVDRAIDYAKNGPNKEVLKAAAEIQSMFNRRTLIQGDEITILTTDWDDDTVDKRITDMSFKYDRFSLNSMFIGTGGSNEEG